MFKVNAQVVVVQDSTQSSQLNISECNGFDTITLYTRIAAGSLNNNIYLIDSFTSDFEISNVLSHSAILSVTGLGTSVIRIQIDSAMYHAAINGLTFKILLKAKCGAASQAQAKHYMRIVANNTIWKNTTSADFISNIKSPNLLLEARNQVDNPNAQIDSTYIRLWRIRNTGLASTIDTVDFAVKYQTGVVFESLKIDGISISPTIIGDSLHYSIQKLLRNQSNYPADTIYIEEKYKVVACTPSGTSSTINASASCWGQVLCMNSKLFATSNVVASVPKINAKIISIKILRLMK